MNTYAPTTQRTSRRRVAEAYGTKPLLESLEPRLLLSSTVAGTPTPAYVSELLQGQTFYRTYTPGQKSETFAVTLKQGNLDIERSDVWQLNWKIFDKSQNLLATSGESHGCYGLTPGETVYVEVTPKGDNIGPYMIRFYDRSARDIGTGDFNGDGRPETAFYKEEAGGSLLLRDQAGIVISDDILAGMRSRGWWFEAKKWQVIDINSDGRADLLNTEDAILLLNNRGTLDPHRLGVWSGIGYRNLSDVQFMRLNSDNWVDIVGRNQHTGDWMTLVSQPFGTNDFLYNIKFLGCGIPDTLLPVRLVDAAGNPRLADFGLRLTAPTVRYPQDYFGSIALKQTIPEVTLTMAEYCWDPYSIAAWGDIPLHLLGFTPTANSGRGLDVDDMLICQYVQHKLFGAAFDFRGTTARLIAAIEADPRYQIQIQKGFNVRTKTGEVWDPRFVGMDQNGRFYYPDLPPSYQMPLLAIQGLNLSVGYAGMSEDGPLFQIFAFSAQNQLIGCTQFRLDAVADADDVNSLEDLVNQAVLALYRQSLQMDTMAVPTIEA